MGIVNDVKSISSYDITTFWPVGVELLKCMVTSSQKNKKKTFKKPWKNQAWLQHAVSFRVASTDHGSDS